MATTLHLYSQEKLFDRAIATGGSCLLIPTFSSQDYERVYQHVLSTLGLAEFSSEERIQKLLTWPMDDIIARLPPSVAFLPLIDGDIVPSKPTFTAISDQNDTSMPGKRWTKGFMIGDSQFDVGGLAPIHDVMIHLAEQRVHLPYISISFFANT